MAITITPSGVPSSGVAPLAVDGTYTASGGTPIYVFSISAGALPPGLSLSSSGLLTGTATIAGTYNFTVHVEDSTTATATLPQTMTVEISAGTWSDNQPVSVGQNYSGEMNGDFEGATPPFTFSLHSGTLPPGTSLNPTTGVVSGITTTAGTFTFTIRLTDHNGVTADVTATDVLIGIDLTVSNYPSSVLVGTPLSGAQLTAVGGTPPYTFGDDALPPGISLNTSTGAITGSFTTPGTYITNWTVTDADSNTGTVQSTVVVFAVALSVPNSGDPSRIPLRWNDDDCLKAGHQMARLIFDAVATKNFSTILRGSLQQPIGLVKSLMFNVDWQGLVVNSGDLGNVQIEIIATNSLQRILLAPPVGAIAAAGDATANFTISGVIPFFVQDDANVTVNVGSDAANQNFVTNIPVRLFFCNWEVPPVFMSGVYKTGD